MAGHEFFTLLQANPYKRYIKEIIKLRIYKLIFTDRLTE
jgi:hypothetical protein